MARFRYLLLTLFLVSCAPTYVKPTPTQISSALYEAANLINDPHAIEPNWYRARLQPSYVVTYPEELKIPAVFRANVIYNPKLEPTYEKPISIACLIISSSLWALFGFKKSEFGKSKKESLISIISMIPIGIANLVFCLFVFFIFYAYIALFSSPGDYISLDFGGFVGCCVSVTFLIFIVCLSPFARGVSFTFEGTTKLTSFVRENLDERRESAQLKSRKAAAEADFCEAEVKELVTNLLNIIQLLGSSPEDDAQLMLRFNDYLVRLTYKELPVKYRRIIRHDMKLVAAGLKQRGQGRGVAYGKVRNWISGRT